MADGAAVLAGIARAPGVDLWRADAEPQGLRGGAGGRRVGGGDLRLGVGDASASATSTARSPRAWRDSRRWPRRRAADGMPLRGYVSCVTDCPFEGAIAPRSGRTRDRPAFRARLPRGQPRRHHRPRHALIRWRGCCRRCSTSRSPERLAGHFHDTARAGARQHRGGARATGSGSSTPPAAGSAAAPSRRARGKCRDRTGGCAAGGRSASRPGSTRAAGGGGRFRPRAAGGGVSRSAESTQAAARRGAAT